jgi:hypothetical protein
MMSNYKLNIALKIILIMVAFPFFAHADTVILKTGEKIESRKVWEEGGKIRFYYHGLIASVSRNEVDRVEVKKQEPKGPHSTQEKKIDNGRFIEDDVEKDLTADVPGKKIDRIEAKRNDLNGSASAQDKKISTRKAIIDNIKTDVPYIKTKLEKRPSMPADNKDNEKSEGNKQKFATQPRKPKDYTLKDNRSFADWMRLGDFRDVPWGAKLKSTKGLVKLKKDGGLEGVKEYCRLGDVLEFEGLELKSVVYAFWQDSLFTVTLWTEAYPNYIALRKWAFKLFGEGRQNSKSDERFFWSDDTADRMLEYIEEGRYGMLWMRSKHLDRQYKLAKLSGPISYSRWALKNGLARQESETSKQ